jgi:hypothetical protein
MAAAQKPVQNNCCAGEETRRTIARAGNDRMTGNTAAVNTRSGQGK